MQGVRVQGLLFECPHGGVMPGVSRHGAQPGSPSLCFFLRRFLLLLFCFRFIVCLLALIYLFIPPPSLANFSARIAFIHESPPFLSLTRARSNCRREEARTLFPLFKVTRLVPGPGASSVLLPTLRVSCPCPLPPRPPPGCRGRWEGGT